MDNLLKPNTNAIESELTRSISPPPPRLEGNIAIHGDYFSQTGVNRPAPEASSIPVASPVEASIAAPVEASIETSAVLNSESYTEPVTPAASTLSSSQSLSSVELAQLPQPSGSSDSSESSGLSALSDSSSATGPLRRRLPAPKPKVDRSVDHSDEGCFGSFFRLFGCASPEPLSPNETSPKNRRSCY